MTFINHIKNLTHLNVIKQAITAHNYNIALKDLEILADRLVWVVAFVVLAGQLEWKVKAVLLLLEFKMQYVLVVFEPENSKSTVTNVARSQVIVTKNGDNHCC
jgi:hypothetical protein